MSPEPTLFKQSELPVKTKGPLRTMQIKVHGDPLASGIGATFIKPAELVDAVEISPLNRSELLLYNCLLANAWNDLTEGGIYSIRKADLRSTHDSNDRLHESFDKLMGAFAKIRHRNPKTGKSHITRINLLGPNTEEKDEDGYFTYTFQPALLAIMEHSRAWARLKLEIMYMLRSKYSIRLYELVERRINMKQQGEYFRPDELRQLLGVPKGKLKRFADFNKHCLKPAVAEINEITDFMVAIGAIRRGRSIEKLHLTWFKKSPEEQKQATLERERSYNKGMVKRKGRIDVVAA